MNKGRQMARRARGIVMRNKIVWGWIILAVAVVFSARLASGIQNQSDHKLLFEKARFAMETKGDLQGAIKLFQEIVAKYPKEKEYASKAQLYIGLCYEKLGNAEAIKAYELVLKNFADRPEEVAVARERLASLRQEEGSGIIKKNLPISDIEFDPYDVSPDGTKILGMSTDVGDNLAVLDVSTGRTDLITHFDHSEDSRSAGEPIWSADGKEIAYAQHPNKGYRFLETPSELRAISLEGKSRVLYLFEEGDIQPCNWLRDGSGVVILLMNKDRSFTLGLVSLRDRGFKALYSIPAGTWPGGAWADASPDGRYIAYSDTNAGHRDIHIYSFARQQSHVLIDHPANDTSPRWSHDGKYLVFKSNRHGAYALWGLEMNEGQAVGDPFMIKEVPQGLYMGTWSSHGLSCYEYLEFCDVFFQAFDPLAKRLIGKPRILSATPLGRNFCPRWSPDGKMLAFYSSSNEDIPQLKLEVMAQDGKDRKEFSAPFRTFGEYGLPFKHYFSWLADGSGIYLISLEAPDTRVLEVLDLASGKWTAKVRLGPPRYPWLIAPDHGGSSLIFTMGSSFGLDQGIYKRNLETGEEKCIYRADQTSRYGPTHLRFSRDFRSLAFVEFESGREDSQRVFKILDMDSGVVHPFYSGAEEVATGHEGPVFSPDGKDLMVFAEDESKWFQSVGLIPAAGGPLQKLKLDVSWPRGTDLNNRLINLDWSPDGKQIAFTAFSNKEEMYLLKNIAQKKKAEEARNRPE